MWYTLLNKTVHDNSERRNTMGYRIKEVREEKRMSQEELSAKSGVSRRIISELETGIRTSTTTKTLVAIATALGTTVDSIFFTESV